MLHSFEQLKLYIFENQNTEKNLRSPLGENDWYFQGYFTQNFHTKTIFSYFMKNFSQWPILVNTDHILGANIIALEI